MQFGRLIRCIAIVVAVGLLTSCGDSETSSQTSGRSESEISERPLNFVREYVVVEPSPGRTRVVGTYHIRNDSDHPAEMGILYPFPVDRDHLSPHVVRLWEDTDDGFRTKGFTRREADILFTLVFEPREEKVFRAEYVQRIVDRHAVYIVTTTRRWERPIELAEFEFRIPASLVDVELSFEPDTTETLGDTTVHFLRRESFYPSEDLVVTWSDERGGGTASSDD